MKKKIQFNNLANLNRQYVDNFSLILQKHIENSDFISGKSVEIFEENFKKIIKSKYCVSSANGSDALMLALKALGLKKNDEVITTSFSWIATSASITMSGGKVIFCDIAYHDFNIDIKAIESKITKKTVGIIPVHLYGKPANIIEINKIAKKYNLWVIEDCAQAHLAKVKNTYVGNYGDIGIFSFFPAKNLGALGDAGCLITNNKKLSYKARLIANHGGKGKHILEGINSRMDSIQASFLNEKLKDLKKNITKRKKAYIRYIQNLKKIDNSKIIIPKFSKNDAFHQFPILVNKNIREKLIKYLNKFGIETKIFYSKPLPFYPAYKYLKLNKKDFKNSIKVSNEVICLPLNESINFKQIDYISKKLIEYLNKI